MAPLTVAVCVCIVGCAASDLPAQNETTAVIGPTATPEVSQAVAPTESAVGTLASEATAGQIGTVDLGDTEAATLVLTSPAFVDGGTIPTRYSCDGEDVSPPLSWTDPPDATASFALIVDDPDAPSGTWVHWVVYNIPASVRSLPEDVPMGASLSEGTQQGKNSWPRLGYGGPCPPSGTHRYVFTLYALDIVLDLAPDVTDKAALLTAMDGHVLAQATAMGLYER